MRLLFCSVWVLDGTAYLGRTPGHSRWYLGVLGYYELCVPPSARATRQVSRRDLMVHGKSESEPRDIKRKQELSEGD